MSYSQKTTSFSPESPEFRKLVIRRFLQDREYIRKIGPYIKPEYFFESEGEREIVKISLSIIKEYKKPPTLEMIRAALHPSFHNELNGLASDDLDINTDREWLYSVTESWCRLRATILAVQKAISVIDGENKKLRLESIPSMLQTAVSLSFDKEIGHSYNEEPEKRWEQYHIHEKIIPTGLDFFDKILKGGLRKKTLSLWISGTGVGKSLTLCHLAANAIRNGYNALYITLELAEHKIAQRIDQNILDVNEEELMKLSKGEFKSRFQNVFEKYKGKLVIKEYGTGSASSLHFNVLLDELETKKKFKPDIIYIDYINLCASARAAGGANTYEKIKHVAEELRTIAIERDIALVTASQVTRAGNTATEIDVTHTSESIALPQTADFMMALVTTDSLRKEGVIKCTQIKNRFNDPTFMKNHMVGIDYAKMKLYDLATQPAHITAENMAVVSDATKPALEKQYSSYTGSKNNDEDVLW